MNCLVLFTFFLASIIDTITAQKENSCEATPKPNFAAGLRISEQKCREYNWIRKNLEKCSTSQDTSNTEYPYMGGLAYRKIDEKEDKALRFLCGTFLVSPKFALTAAHCIRSVATSAYKAPEIVRFGNTDVKTADTSYVDAKIKRIIVHPEYVPPKKNFDIAIIELESELQLTRSILPACLWSQTTIQETGSVSVPNFGTTDSHTTATGVLHAPKVEIVDHVTCLSIMEKHFNRNWNKIEDHQICVNESISAVHICKGSGGSPMISEANLDGSSDDKMPYAIGVASFGLGCNGGIGIYTRISSFIDWIEKTVF